MYKGQAVLFQVLGVFAPAAVKRLRESDIEPFKTPPSNVNNLSRTLYFTVKAALEIIDKNEKKEKVTA